MSQYEKECDEIDSLIKDISVLIASLDTLDADIEDNLIRFDLSERQLEDLKEYVGFCPFCGTVFDRSKDHIHDS